MNRQRGYDRLKREKGDEGSEVEIEVLEDDERNVSRKCCIRERGRSGKGFDSMLRQFGSTLRPKQPNIVVEFLVKVD